MTTDEMILALVATGRFTLPDGLTHAPMCEVPWSYSPIKYMFSVQAAHDLCAMHFARQYASAHNSLNGGVIERVYQMMGVGNSAAAIKALWGASK